MKPTKEHLENLIADISYHHLDGTTVTICALKMHSGFVVIGKSACLDPGEFSEVMGKKFAYDNAIEQLWELEGYHVKALAAQIDDWLDRLRIERDELAAKVEKLAAFLDSGKTCQSGEVHHALLVAQLPHMRAYLDVLNQRIQLAEDDNAG
ncbi:MAG: Gp49 family protein [Cardiobacterium hominis]